MKRLFLMISSLWTGWARLWGMMARLSVGPWTGRGLGRGQLAEVPALDHRQAAIALHLLEHLAQADTVGLADAFARQGQCANGVFLRGIPQGGETGEGAVVAARDGQRVGAQDHGIGSLGLEGAQGAGLVGGLDQPALAAQGLDPGLQAGREGIAA